MGSFMFPSMAFFNSPSVPKVIQESLLLWDLRLLLFERPLAFNKCLAHAGTFFTLETLKKTVIKYSYTRTTT